MEKISLGLQDSIADTLLITLYAKSVESVKKDPLIQDRTACTLVEKIEYDFTKYKNKKATSVGVALRANHFDQMVKTFIKNNADPVIVFVGCGLDTRIQRIGLVDKPVEFYQLDIEEVIKARETLIPAQNNEHLIASSMLETAWMDQLKVQHPTANFMFVIEGVLMYFNEAQNKQFFLDLVQRFSDAEVHFDILNQWMSRQTALHDTVSKTNATFKFGMDDNQAIEQWHPRLKLINVYRFNDFKGWRRMGLVLTTFMSVIPRFKHSSRILVYKIN